MKHLKILLKRYISLMEINLDVIYNYMFHLTLTSNRLGGGDLIEKGLITKSDFKRGSLLERGA